jgi:hypothetical protein
MSVGGGGFYSGSISTIINSCVKNGSSYTINASFTFTSDGFNGAKLPSLSITSSSGGSVYLEGNRYDNDPLTKSFSIDAVAGDTITISSAYWDDPSDSGSSAYLDSPSNIYTIPAEEVKEVSISGAVDVAKTFSKAIAGIVDIKKAISKSITGAVSIDSPFYTEITGTVNIDNPNERVSSQSVTAMVRIQKTGSGTITGMVRIARLDTATIQGGVRVWKSQTATISGLARIGRKRTDTITGRVKIRVAVPEKLPEDWDYNRVAEPEEWEKVDKTATSWSETEKTDEDWSETEKDATSWTSGDVAVAEEWSYPLEDTG